MPRRPTNILHVRVRSPRLAWLGFLGILGRMVKLGFLAAVLTAIGWAGYKGYQRVVLENPDFQLRVIDLNPNPVLDEPSLVALTGLDLQANLTRIDTTTMRETLLAHPAITGARIERHLPDTLVIRITTREPRAWVAMPDAGHPVRREAGAMLIDADRIPYPCPELQLEAATTLPVIVLKPEPDQPLTPGTRMRHAELAPCLRLLDNIDRHTPGLLAAIDTLDQPTPWSVRALTRSGTEATFGLHGHDRQLRRFDVALAHTTANGRPLATINLIPRENIPVTFRADAPPPRETPAPVAAEEPIPVAIPINEADLDDDRRAGDLDAILNRN